MQHQDLQVVGAGLGRTGTNSLKLALEILYGRPCYHMLENIQHGHSKVWVQAFEEGFQANRDEVLKVLSPYVTAVDFPTQEFCLDLIREFPDAKVVLTVRDFESWYNSCLSTIYYIYKEHRKVPVYVKALAPPLKWLTRLTGLGYFGPEGRFKGRFEDKEFVHQVFDAWYRHIQETVPADKLLLFHPRDGWEPLCRFLGKPVPEQPFPRVNDTAEFQARARIIVGVPKALAVIIPALGVGLPLLAAYLMMAARAGGRA